MAEALSKGTFIRIKRRLEDEPLNEIVISSKKQCFGLESNNKSSCTDLTLCKRVDSVPVKCNFIQHARRLLSEQRTTRLELKLNYKLRSGEDIREKLKAETKAISAERRYALTACRRKMLDEDGELLQFKVFQAELEDDSECSHAGGMKMPKELISGSVKLDLPMLAQINGNDTEAITCNGEQMIVSDDDSCYDIFYTELSSELIDMLQSAVHHDKRSSTMGRKPIWTENDKIYDELTDDENEEDNYRNNYPDELSSDSDDEGMSTRLRSLGIVDSCSEGSSDECDSEDGPCVPSDSSEILNRFPLLRRRNDR